MRPIQERLAMLAADLREDSRKAGIAAEQARPDVEDTAAVLATLQQTEADLNAQIDELERRLAETRRHILQAEAEHEQAKSVFKSHERDGQEAADMAARLDQLARSHRAPDAVPPAEALAATGVMPPKDIEPNEHTGGNAEDCPICRPLIDQPGGILSPWLCTGGEEDAPPAPGALPVATPPVPRAPVADMTMPDVGPPVEPLPPAEPGQARHAAPRDSTGTGRLRTLGEALGLVHRDGQADEQQGDGQ